MAPNVVEKIIDALHLPSAHKRGDEASAEGAPATATAEGVTKKPIFDNEKVTVIFVLGGPGAGMPFLPSFSSPPPHMPFEFIIIIIDTICFRQGNAMQPSCRKVQLLPPFRG